MSLHTVSDSDTAQDRDLPNQANESADRTGHRGAVEPVYSHVLATFSPFERRLIGQRTKDALAAKRAAGVRLGRPRVIPEDVVARIIAERSSGATFRAIADSLNRDGRRPYRSGSGDAAVRQSAGRQQLRGHEPRRSPATHGLQRPGRLAIGGQ
jgi:DNA invertase Pin-like site-specific DNA recombinase